MSEALPDSAEYCVVGAGVHGLSTAWHLAKELQARDQGSGKDILVLDKKGIAAGASGVACGVVRNFYYQPAMGHIMRVSVEVWESDPDAFHYRPVGYIALAPEVQAGDIETIYERHQQMGYGASLVRGEERVFAYMRQMFPDWKARGLTVCLHEHQGGFAFNVDSIRGLAGKARSQGVRIQTGVRVTGFRIGDPDGTVRAVRTDRGEIEVGQVVVAVGPWIQELWSMLELPNRVDVREPDGTVHQNLPMWTYWLVREGEIEVDPKRHVTADGKTPPVLHVDSTEPLRSDRDGHLITDDHWGIYFMQDRAGVQGGAVPVRIGHEAQVDPYGPESELYTVGEDFADYWTAGLAHCLERFEGESNRYKKGPRGGLGCFTVDNFPVFDHMRPNAYVIADSNHGYKMIGVGKEVAGVLLGRRSGILHPFRFSRFAEGDLHPTSSSPFPWS